MVPERRKTRPVVVGGLTIGGEAPVSLQTMLKADPCDRAANLEQAQRLERTGVRLVRMAIPDRTSLQVLSTLREQTSLLLVADIHFDYRLALESMAAGAHKVRINPGNIGEKRKVQAVAREAVSRRVALRVGVNAGSLEREVKEQFGGVTAAALVQSALEHLDVLAQEGLQEAVVSLKSSDVLLTLEAYRQFSQCSDYPLHLGVTEAGTAWSGTIRSSVGIGALLAQGIGDTIRVSLTAEPEEEVQVGRKILESLHLASAGPLVISCPTCGRCNIDVGAVAARVERALGHLNGSITIAVMGCAVNGPGEAAAADVGIAGGKGEALLFRQGKVVRKVEEEHMYEALMREVCEVLGRDCPPELRRESIQLESKDAGAPGG